MDHELLNYSNRTKYTTQIRIAITILINPVRINFVSLSENKGGDEVFFIIGKVFEVSNFLL
jgi:hypothetical protein